MNSLLPLPCPIDQIRFAYTTRRLRHADIAGLLVDAHAPEAGQLVLAEVIELGQHYRLELPSGRKSLLYPGVLIVVAYGDRYAPDQFEGRIPDHLGECHLIAAGGLAGCEIARHATIKPATRIRPLGLLANARGEPLNLADYALPELPAASRPRPLTLFVCGTSMNAGKTFTAHETVRGLRALGQRVAAAKVTGTGAGNDAWRLLDCGAWPVYDFTDAGMPSTYCMPMACIENGMIRVLSHLAASGAEAIVVEIADGIGQAETAALLHSPHLHAHCDGVLFAAGDAIAAQAGVDWLRKAGLPVLAVSGLLTAEPALGAEAAQLLDAPVLSAADLANGEALRTLIGLAPGCNATALRAVA